VPPSSLRDEFEMGAVFQTLACLANVRSRSATIGRGQGEMRRQFPLIRSCIFTRTEWPPWLDKVFMENHG